jgi:S-adenosylmethionine hydrolase
MEAAGQYFVAPDNGALATVYGREAHKIRLISNEKYFLKPVSRTFHGRDIFAPVAAHLASGVAPSRMGKIVKDYLRPVFEKPQRTGKRTWTGRILRIDRFGNVVTNFHMSEFPDLEQRNFTLTLGPCAVGVMARSYAECGPGELFAIEGSSGYVEVSVGQGSAAKRIGCESGAAVELTVW